MRILILGGTTEATAIARALAGDARYDPVLSYAGRTSAPKPPPIPWRAGGFGGVAGLAAYLREEHIVALIDATHPFAARMKANAVAAAHEAGIPRITVLRPAWEAGPGDRWIAAATMAGAYDALGPVPRRVLLTVGRQELAPFRAPHRYWVRSIDPPDTMPPNATLLTARGPFAAADEQALLEAHRIEVVVSKNAGGEATAAKLEAARALGLPVVMVARPPPPEGPVVPDAAAALAWLAHQRALRGV